MAELLLHLTEGPPWEAVPGGEEFPHIDGPVPVDAVVDVRSWPRKEGSPA